MSPVPGRRAIRRGHAALVLAAVVAVAGCGGGDGPSSRPSTTSVERVGSWEDVGPLVEGRGGHTATLLQDGTVLVAGGSPGGDNVDGLRTTERFDPATGRWRAAGIMSTARAGHAATLLPDGSVLVTGGVRLATAEVYDPVADTWAEVAAMSVPRNGHTLTLLRDGRVLVVGGFPALETPPSATAEVYDPAARRWSPAGQMTGSRGYHAATVLADGRVLVSAGNAANLSRQVPSASTTTTTAGFITPPTEPGGGEVATAEVFDPASGSWSPTGSLGAARSAHTASLLPDGRVLVTGGFSPGGVIGSAELYDPAAGTWAAAEAMPSPRAIHTATLLRNGQVLVLGGRSGTNGSVLSAILPSGGLYDPATGKWRAASEMEARRVSHSATLFADGRVLVVGGLTEEGPVATAEVFTLGG